MADLFVIGLRWLQFAGATSLFGVALFQLYSPMVGLGAELRRWSRMAALILGLSAAAGLVAQTVVMAGSLPQALDPVALDFVARQTQLGLAHLVRMGLAVVAFLVAFIAMPTRARAVILALLGLGICASFVWSGHAGATPGTLGHAHIASDVLHVAAAGAWIGALVAFVMASANEAAVAPRDLGRALSAFAGIGTAAVVVLVLSGALNAFVLIGPAAAAVTLTTAYGQWLALKLVLFLAMLGLAVLNRFRLTPALAAAASPESGIAALADLRSSLRGEAMLGALVLAVVAVLGTLGPHGAS